MSGGIFKTYKKCWCNRMLIKKNETVLQGKWKKVDGKLVADDVSLRIMHLIEKCLQEIVSDVSGWCKLYIDPSDGRFWELVYLGSESHGGGAPTLLNISKKNAEKKYKIDLYIETSNNFYDEIEKILINAKSKHLEDFKKNILLKNKKEVFIWLDELFRKGELPKNIDSVLTDFFYSIH